MGKQLKRILPWKSVREVYVSICKVYLKNENTCPFVQLQLQTEQISEGRSRCHCWAPQKNWVTWNKPSSDLQILTHRGDRSIETNNPKSELRKHSSQELISFTFHSSVLIWEKGEGGVGGEIPQREVFHAWIELKKVGWTFPMLEKVHLQLQIALLQAVWQSNAFQCI